VNATWRERVVVDIQPYGDIIHSGYPVVISYDYAFSAPQNACFLFDVKEVFDRGWDLIHEISHNMQRASWTPGGTEEVTVNLFPLHAFEVVFQEKAWSNRFFLEKQNKKALIELARRNFQFKDWSSQPYVALILYAQLINSFGWNSFKIIFREYETLTDSEKIFKSDLDKWNQWICRFSNIVGLNVSPLFYFWGVPFSKTPGTSLDELTPWLPDDDYIRILPTRVSLVKEQFPKLIIGNESTYSTCSY
jgi:hypothetical protein